VTARSGYDSDVAITRDDVAKQAGVSSAVVSYVINDGPRPVSADARSRVLAAISELGYQRNGSARDLALGRSTSIGLVVPDISLPYFGRVTQSIASLASAAGLQLLVGTSGWDLAQEQAQLRALAERRVEGLILMSVDPSQDLTSWTSLGIPVAVVDRPEFAIEGSAAATAHLIEHGRREVGMISGSLEFLMSSRRRDGWRSARQASGLTAPDSAVEAAEISLEGGWRAAGVLLDRIEGLDGIFVESDLQALGVLRALHERGLRVPDDIAIATADTSMFPAYSVPTLTTLQGPIVDVAQAAIDAVTEHAAMGVQRLDVLGFELLVGESCGCVAYQPAIGHSKK
jgi:LacI family transcriptional regulator